MSSGFLWRQNDQVFLITNWHCLTGKHPTTMEPLGSFLPNSLEVACRLRILVAGAPVSRQLTFELPLQDEYGDPLWLAHPDGPDVDVAAIRVPYSEDTERRFFCLNEIDFEERWRPEPSSDAFIVGFPEGLCADLGTPIWKRASIASEPEIGFGGKPVVLVDTIGNRGLSGAPVVARGSGMYVPNGVFDEDAVIGTWKKFLGVYSGRLNEDGIGSQLGHVWRASVIDEVLNQGALA